jgi:hypothetical protein
MWQGTGADARGEVAAHFSLDCSLVFVDQCLLRHSHWPGDHRVSLDGGSDAWPARKSGNVPSSFCVMDPIPFPSLLPYDWNGLSQALVPSTLGTYTVDRIFFPSYTLLVSKT